MRLTAIALLLALLPCCVVKPPALLFANTTTPLDRNFDSTPILPAAEDGDVKRFSYSVIDIAWDSAGIGDVAKKKSGFETIYYVDLEVLKVLWVWTQYRVHVYGK